MKIKLYQLILALILGLIIISATAAEINHGFHSSNTSVVTLNSHAMPISPSLTDNQSTNQSMGHRMINKTGESNLKNQSKLKKTKFFGKKSAKKHKAKPNKRHSHPAT